MAKKPVKPVIKPYLRGSWHGKDAKTTGTKMILNILFVTFIYLLLGLILSFNGLILRVLSSVVIILFAALYMYSRGMNSGEADTAFAEIIYQHQAEGKAIVQSDRDRCFHPGKGFYSILIALIPYLLITIVFAAIVQPITYSLGLLPTWLTEASRQTHMQEALAYYNQQDYSLFMPLLRMVVRALTMPFINLALPMGTNAVYIAELLSPLWVMIAPLAYGIGYLQGPRLRIKVNTGIAIGMRKKARKAKKERKARAASKKPEQLI